MTHKSSLLPLLGPSSDLFSTLKKEGAEEYHCCFGCKKMMKDRAKMRQHMKASEECCTKHKQYLRDIGLDIEVVEQDQNKNSDNKIIKGLQAEVDGLRAILEEYKEGYHTKRLESDLAKAQIHIRRLEEFYHLIPFLMKPEHLNYCNKFVLLWKANQSSIVDGYLKKERKEALLNILRSVPLLQMYFTPSYNFLLNHHAPNGEHEGLLCGYFNKLDYTPLESPSSRQVDNLPPLPVWDIVKDEKTPSAYIPTLVDDEDEKKDEEEEKPVYRPTSLQMIQAQKPIVEPQQKIIQNTKQKRMAKQV